MAFPATIESKRLYTSEEFEALNLPDDENTYELIDGELVVSPPAGDEHGGIADTIRHKLSLFDPDRKLGRVRQATRYQVAPGFSPAPDLAFVKAERAVPVTKGAVPTRPDLAVEIWSPHDLDTRKRQHDARDKIRKYQVGGVPVVWAINPETKEVEVYHPDQAEPVQVLGINDELSGEDVIPGFNLSVKMLFE